MSPTSSQVPESLLKDPWRNMRTEAAAKGDKGCGCRLRKEHEETSRDHGNTVTGIQAYIHEAQGERERCRVPIWEFILQMPTMTGWAG